MNYRRFGVWGLGALLLCATLVWAQSMSNRTDMWNFVNGIYVAEFMGGKAVSGTSAGALTLGSSAHTSVAIITDGGTVTIDGAVTAAGAVTLSNLETISNGTNGTVTLGRNDSGTLTVTAADDDATAALTVLPGGAAAFTLGGASTTAITLTTDGGSLVVDGPNVSTGTGGSFTVKRSDTGTVTVTAADDDATAALSVLPGGAAAMTLGGASTTAITLTTDGGSLIVDGPNVSTGTGGSFTVKRSDTGTVTVTAADDDATAALTVVPGGAAALTLGGASATAITLTTDGGSLIVDGPNVSTGTGGAFTVKRSDAGIVSITAADDDATAALTILPGGAAAMVLGGASMTSLTVTADGAQDADVVLPANSIGGAEVSGMPMQLVYCGQADENGTIYLSPTAGVNGVDFADGVDYSISGTACDGLDGATESTQDLIIFPEVAFKVMGMYCQQAGAEALGAAETMVFTFRAGEADTTPAITCTIAEGQRGCRSLTGTTTNVAANAATAMKLVQVSNNSDQDGFCIVSIMLQ